MSQSLMLHDEFRVFVHADRKGYKCIVKTDSDRKGF